MTKVTDQEPDMLLAVGTYTEVLAHVKGHGQGIHLLGFDSRTGAILPGPAFGGVVNPTWLTASADGRRLYSVQEREEADGAAVDCFALDTATFGLEPLARASSGGSWPCHISISTGGETLFVSNYGDGRLGTLSLNTAGLPAGAMRVRAHEGRGPNPLRQEGPHLHQAVPTPDGRHILLCEAGLDRIIRYPLHEGRLSDAPGLTLHAEPGSFPRHLAFLPDGSGFLVTHELANTVDAYRHDAGGAARCGCISILPADWTGESAAAAIRIHPSGRFAYASNRGHDTLCGIDLRAGLDDLRTLGWWSTQGQAPRDFIIDPTGRFIIIANQNSDNLVVYAVDVETGALRLLRDDYALATPVSLCLINRAGVATG